MGCGFQEDFLSQQMSLANYHQKPLTCSYWNIHGYKSKIVGNKLYDPQFLKVVSKSDVIIGLGELHAKEEIFIPGFISLKQKNTVKKHKGPKLGGGIAVLVREGLE